MVVPNDGSWTQKQLFDQKRTGQSIYIPGLQVPDIEIAFDKVPRLINPKQFESIAYRRKMRLCIEAERLKMGRPVDGRRKGEYKYEGKHLHALNRVRGAGGTFARVNPAIMDIENHVPSITN